MIGPERTLAEVLNTAQQRHETGHSFIAQHFCRPDDGCAGQTCLSSPPAEWLLIEHGALGLAVQRSVHRL
jgi:hypothetical protein